MTFTSTVSFCPLPASSATVPPHWPLLRTNPAHCDLLPQLVFPVIVAFHLAPLLPAVPFFSAYPTSTLLKVPWTSEAFWATVDMAAIFCRCIAPLVLMAEFPHSIATYSVTGRLCCLTPQRDCRFPETWKDNWLIFNVSSPSAVAAVNPYWMMEWTSALISQDFVMEIQKWEGIFWKEHYKLNCKYKNANYPRFSLWPKTIPLLGEWRQFFTSQKDLLLTSQDHFDLEYWNQPNQTVFCSLFFCLLLVQMMLNVHFKIHSNGLSQKYINE